MPDAIITYLVRSKDNNHLAYAWTNGYQRNMTIRAKPSSLADRFGDSGAVHVHSPLENQAVRTPEDFARDINGVEIKPSILELVFPRSAETVAGKKYCFAEEVAMFLPETTQVVAYSGRNFKSYPKNLEDLLAMQPSRHITDRETLDALTKLLRPGADVGFAHHFKGAGLDFKEAYLEPSAAIVQTDMQPYNLRPRRKAGGSDAAVSLPKSAGATGGGRVRRLGAEVKREAEAASEFCL